MKIKDKRENKKNIVGAKPDVHWPLTPLKHGRATRTISMSLPTRWCMQTIFFNNFYFYIYSIIKSSLSELDYNK